MGRKGIPEEVRKEGIRAIVQESVRKSKNQGPDLVRKSKEELKKSGVDVKQILADTLGSLKVS